MRLQLNLFKWFRVRRVTAYRHLLERNGSDKDLNVALERPEVVFSVRNAPDAQHLSEIVFDGRIRQVSRHFDVYRPRRIVRVDIVEAFCGLNETVQRLTRLYQPDAVGDRNLPVVGDNS